MREEGDVLVLTIAAPEGAELVLQDLVDAFRLERRGTVAAAGSG